MAEKTKTKTKSKAKKSTTSSSKTSAKKKTTKKAAPKKKSTTKKTTKKIDTSKYAVVEVNGAQLLVKEGEAYEVNRIDGTKGEEKNFEKVLFIANDKDVSVGKPYIKGASVDTIIDSQKKGKKMRVFKYKSKSRYRRTYGHRDHITRLLVTKING